MLIIGIAGGVVAWRRRLKRSLALAALAGVCLFFYFLVEVKDHQHVYVGWRVGHFLFIVFAALVALALDETSRLSQRLRLAAWTVAAGLALAALPTTAIDLFNTQDLSNRNQAPGFRWTLILTHDDQDVIAFLRQHTPPNALVQVDPLARHSETWAYLPAFAERRMAAGYPISMVPLAKYQAASEEIRHIYATHDLLEAFEIARRAKVDYLIVGPPEREAHPGCGERFDSAPEDFKRIFTTGTVLVFERQRQLGEGAPLRGRRGGPPIP
jgi:hypothetical protein